MEKGLAQLGAIPHVGGAFVCDNKGDVIVSSDPAVLATVTMNTIGREVGRAFIALEAAGRAASRMELVYDSWRLFAHDISDAVVFVVCQPAADMAMVRMTVDVVVAGWRKDSGAQKRLARHKAVRRELVNRSQLDNGAWQTWSMLEARS
jgi:hypothetical protein